MAFVLDIPDHIATYLESLQVSQSVREMIADTLAHIEDLPAEFRANAANRAAWHPLLRCSRVFIVEGDPRTHTITFAINDESAVYGVLRIPHARHTVS